MAQNNLNYITFSCAAKVDGRNVIAILTKTGSAPEADVDGEGQIDISLIGTKSGNCMNEHYYQLISI
jgi:hypothetical protein